MTEAAAGTREFEDAQGRARGAGRGHGVDITVYRGAVKDEEVSGKVRLLKMLMLGSSCEISYRTGERLNQLLRCGQLESAVCFRRQREEVGRGLDENPRI